LIKGSNFIVGWGLSCCDVDNLIRSSTVQLSVRICCGRFPAGCPAGFISSSFWLTPAHLYMLIEYDAYFARNAHTTMKHIPFRFAERFFLAPVAMAQAEAHEAEAEAETHAPHFLGSQDRTGRD
jgi:hypothetical protein